MGEKQMSIKVNMLAAKASEQLKEIGDSILEKADKVKEFAQEKLNSPEVKHDPVIELIPPKAYRRRIQRIFPFGPNDHINLIP